MHKKIVELIKDFSKVIGYKKYTKKSVIFLYTSREQYENEIKKTIPFTTASNRTKYVGINLMKKYKTCNLKIYRTVLKEIKRSK